MKQMDTPASLVYEDINFTYPGSEETAVRDINLVIQPGELIVLVGPSGCGKSTLLRIAAGLIFPDRGRLLIDGADALNLPPEKRKIGWVPQSYALFDHLDVNGNVAFGLRMLGIPKDQREKRVQEMLRLCRITELSGRSVRELSGGQRQRVAIARALAMNPRVLLLDEPLAALDPQLRVALRADLEALLRESGVTTLFVTHDQTEALAVADRVVILRAGRIEQFDTPEMLWNHPANSFVAEFLGGAITLTAKRLDQDRVLIDQDLIAHLPAAQNESSADIILTLRPGDFVLDSNGTPVVVSSSEYSGGAYLNTGKLISGKTVSFFSQERLVPGETARISIRTDRKLTMVRV